MTLSDTDHAVRGALTRAIARLGYAPSNGASFQPFRTEEEIDAWCARHAL